MPRHIVMLRGINLGPRNRIAMPALRVALEKAGFTAVATYVQSGNVVLTSRASADRVAATIARIIAKEFKLEIAVVARSREELAAVVRRNPLKAIASDPRLYQVSFFDRPLDASAVRRLQGAIVAPERLVVDGRHAYAWHPAGIARSKLWAGLAGRGLGVTATARNWTTVTSLLALADAKD